MSRSPSRLHTLERGLKKPHKSRAKARALTVMRFEGGSVAASAKHIPARLPTDLEEQIAVVRGRAIAKPSRGLLQLEERLLRTYDAEPVAPAVQRYDHGAPSRMTTPAPVPPPSAPVQQASAFSAAAPRAADAFGGQYNVESFEDTSAAGVGQVIGLPVTDYYAGTPPAAVSVVKTELNAGPPPVAIPSVGAVPWASEPYSRRPSKKALTREQQEVAAGFERDLAAMLGTGTPATAAPEDKQWDDTLRTVAQPAPPPSTGVAPQPTPTPAARPDAHEVFNQMGLAMNYANSFDLGAVDLSARFDQFDAELSLESKPMPKPTAPVPVQALALDDFDLVADLAVLSGAQAAAAADATPVSEPVVKPEVTTPPVP